MTNNLARRGLKALLGIASCSLGIAAVYLGLDLNHEPIKKDATASAKPIEGNQTRVRPVRAMNLALGNMVYFAHDLGFTIKPVKGEFEDSGKVALRIENQLQGLREVYRQESAKNPTLVGGMLLQFTVTPAGEVTQVKETSSFITDADFRSAVVAEVGKWSFAELVSEPVIVSCPLLFVREGMDITTLVQWEKALGHFNDKPPLPRAATAAKPVIKASEIAASTPPDKPAKEPPAPVKSVSAEGKIFQIKYPTSLRKNPNFSSSSLMTFTIGTKVVLVNGRGDWLEVKTTDNDLTGFIRKEFVTPLDVAHK